MTILEQSNEILEPTIPQQPETNQVGLIQKLASRRFVAYLIGMLALFGYALHVGDVPFEVMQETTMTLTSVLIGAYAIEDVVAKYNEGK